MNIGALNKQVTLKGYTESTNAFGEVLKTWSTLATVWASVQQISATKKFEANHDRAATTVIVKIRYRSDVTAFQRIEIDGQAYEILGRPKELGRREGLEFLAELKE